MRKPGVELIPGFCDVRDPSVLINFSEHTIYYLYYLCCFLAGVLLKYFGIDTQRRIFRHVRSEILRVGGEDDDAGGKN